MALGGSQVLSVAETVSLTGLQAMQHGAAGTCSCLDKTHAVYERFWPCQSVHDPHRCFAVLQVLLLIPPPSTLCVLTPPRLLPPSWMLPPPALLVPMLRVLL